VQYSTGSEPRSLVHRDTRRMIQLTWRSGIKAALAVCIFAFVINVIIAVTAVTKKGRYHNGIGVLNSGRSNDMARLGAVYHVLINILSTGLLASSNYCMQLLCAPTRHDVDIAHKNGYWLDIGILSFRNLRHVSRRRSILWLILLMSSIPLHLL